MHLSYVREGIGHALIGFRQWIPDEHIADPVTSLRMGLPRGQYTGSVHQTTTRETKAMARATAKLRESIRLIICPGGSGRTSIASGLGRVPWILVGVSGKSLMWMRNV